MKIKSLPIFWKILFFSGWIIFWLSMILPVNTSVGGLTDAGRPYRGFLNLFYSIISIIVIPEEIILGILNPKEYLLKDNLSNTLGIFMMAGVGICNLLMIFSPLIWRFNLKLNLTKYLIIACAAYVCIIGMVVSYHFYPIRYGHYVWCLSFIITACAFWAKAKYKNALP